MTSATRDRISILLADDSDMVREAIRDAVGRVSKIRIVGEAKSFPELLTLFLTLKPQIVLMDMHMPGSVDPAMIKSKLSGSLLLGMSVWNDPETQRLADKFGAVKLLDKANLFTELKAVISEIAPDE